ncbi:hypothetical protein [Flavobacterium sp. K5-23]|uniref:hypothetical protein n=1 Tax=Flavobacterium sp. K5-23 TaxID=2746225 RepID=UPI00200DDA09|nr:hypothetical protein [Flavobacterium sp. K5-23]UQD56217.1 hypothetical protein FLAK523_07380 [Flavobacterium sp. K5-23]
MENTLNETVELLTLPSFGFMMRQELLLKDYHLLYKHYVNATLLPSNFPPDVIKKFPNISFKGQLELAIASLKTEVGYLI